MYRISPAEARHYRAQGAPDPAMATPVGNDVCGGCDGRGWVRFDVDYGHADFGKAQSCPVCNGGDAALMQRIWTVSGLRADDPQAPQLGSFKQDDPQAQVMWEAALAFMANPRGWLTIHGNGGGRTDRGDGRWGAGKSHLGEAIARTLIGRGVPALYIAAPALMTYLGAAWRAADDETDYDRRMAWVQNIPVLIVDQVNSESRSEAVDRRRLELLDARYVAAIRERGGATVLISNDRPAAWHDPAVASRALDRRFVQVEATAVDFRRTGR